MGRVSDVYSTWGDGVANALRDVCTASGQDAYEVIVAAFDRELTLRDFHALAAADFARLSEAANRVFETDRIQPGHMREAVAYVCQHWPLSDQQD